MVTAVTEIKTSMLHVSFFQFVVVIFLKGVGGLRDSLTVGFAKQNLDVLYKFNVLKLCDYVIRIF